MLSASIAVPADCVITIGDTAFIEIPDVPALILAVKNSLYNEGRAAPVMGDSE